MTPEEIEREYNNRLAVPEHPKFFERWERDSEYARRTLEGRLDLAYGPDPRHRIDLFASKGSRGLLIFIHGGYWRALDKKLFAWIAPPFVAAGVSVANVNYRLCPQVRIGDVVDDVVAAVNWLFAGGIAKRNVVVSGHSAGGHLVAALFASTALPFDASNIVGGVAISGVFDLEPLLHYSANEDFRLDAAQARRLSVMRSKPVVAAPLVVAAGGGETREFRRQSRDFAAAWGAQVRQCQILPGYNHFSILDAFIERGQPLHTSTLSLFA